MKRYLLLLFVLPLLVAACGGSDSQPSALCQSVDKVKTDVANLKSTLKNQPTVDSVTTSLKTLQTDVNAAITQAKGTATTYATALKQSMQSIKSTLTQVKDKTLTISTAIPTLKTQAQTVQQNWDAFKSALKC